MHIRLILIATFSIFTLAACHEGGYYDDQVHVSSPLPELTSFAIIDSYNTHSDLEPNTQTALSPYIDDGYFELEWDVAPNVSHRVELMINDRPAPEGGITLSSEWCGPFEDCENNSYQYCFYNPDLSIECALPESNTPFIRRDIAAMISGLPQAVYFVLEVCDEDLSYCEFRTERAVLE